jgi:two-component system nitrogen regulation sensor histidine kinase NtrY
MRPEIKKLNVTLHHECQSEYLTIQADEEMIEQVLINLVKNSAEAAAETPNAAIQLIGKYDTSHVIIEVKDNGSGIIPEAIDKIFVPFYTTKKTGSGIGLALSRQIMQLHNGTLTVESKPDVETVFTMRF